MTVLTSEIAEELGLIPVRSSDDLLANTAAILPVAAAEADESERLTRMTDRMAAAMRAAGVFEMAFPSRRGGLEATLETQTIVVERIATVDAGIAWNAGVLAATGFYAGRLGDDAYAELYPSTDFPTAGCFWPRGRADVVEGGYLVSGFWVTGSGISAAHYVLGGCDVYADGELVCKPGGEALVIGVWLRTDEVAIADDWEVIGLRASGSTGYGVTDVFVPESHTFDRYFEAGRYGDPLERLPELPFYSMNGIPVGIAQHALDLAVERVLTMQARGKQPGERVLGLLGEAESLVRAARSAVLDGVRRIDDVIFSGGIPSDFDRIRGDGPFATQVAQQVVAMLADIVGSAFIYQKNPYERLARDLYPVSVHGTGRRSQWVLGGQAVLDHYATQQTGA